RRAAPPSRRPGERARHAGHHQARRAGSLSRGPRGRRVSLPGDTPPRVAERGARDREAGARVRGAPGLAQRDGRTPRLGGPPGARARLPPVARGAHRVRALARLDRPRPRRNDRRRAIAPDALVPRPPPALPALSALLVAEAHRPAVVVDASVLDDEEEREL